MKRTPLLAIIVGITAPAAFLHFSTSEHFAASILFTFSHRPVPYATLRVAAPEHSGRCYPPKRCEEIVLLHLDVRPRSQLIPVGERNSVPGNGDWK